MSNETLDQLRSQISMLSEVERSTLARELVMNFAGRRDKAVEQAWSDEIVRRVSRVRDGRANLLARKVFRKKMVHRLNKI